MNEGEVGVTKQNNSNAMNSHRVHVVGVLGVIFSRAALTGSGVENVSPNAVKKDTSEMCARVVLPFEVMHSTRSHFH